MQLVFFLGLILLAGLAVEKLIAYLKLPAVTGYLLIGILLGPSLLNILSTTTVTAMAPINTIALGLIAFLIGGELSLPQLKRCGQSAVWITIFQALGAFLFVTLTLHLLIKVSFPLALLFGAVSCATAPAAVMMVLREYKAKGPLTDNLLTVVALDDALCLLLYALAVAAAKVMVGESSGLRALMLKPLGELGVSVLLGVLAAVILLFVIRWLRENEERLLAILGTIFFLAGGADFLHLSPLLACMVMGWAAVNLAPGESRRIFTMIKSLDTPIYVIFFVAAGATLHFQELTKVGLIGIVYIITRVAGKIIGAGLGAKIGRASRVVQKYLGLGLIPQAGVAIGLTLLIQNDFPVFAEVITPVVLASVVVYEITGPFFVKMAVTKAGEEGK